MSKEKHPLTLVAQNEKALIVIHIKDPSVAEKVRVILDTKETAEGDIVNVPFNTATSTIQDITI